MKFAWTGVLDPQDLNCVSKSVELAHAQVREILEGRSSICQRDARLILGQAVMQSWIAGEHRIETLAGLALCSLARAYPELWSPAVSDAQTNDRQRWANAQR